MLSEGQGRLSAPELYRDAWKSFAEGWLAALSSYQISDLERRMRFCLQLVGKNSAVPFKR